VEQKMSKVNFVVVIVVRILFK